MTLRVLNTADLIPAHSQQIHTNPPLITGYYENKIIDMEVS